MDVSQASQAEDIRGRGKRESGGASAEINNSGSSRALGLGLAVLGVLIASGIIWVGSALVGIKESVASLAAAVRVQNDAFAQRLANVEQENREQNGRINQLDRDVSTLEGRNLRGGSVGR